MDRNLLAIVVIRLFSLALGFYALVNISLSIPNLASINWSAATPYYLGIMSFILILALVIWKFPVLALKIISGSKEKQLQNYDAISLEKLGYTILGLYLAFYVISDITYWSYVLLASFNAREVHVELSTDQIGRIIATVVELVFVVVLLFGQKGLSELLYKIRHGCLSENKS
jgi:hypothetical protein